MMKRSGSAIAICTLPKWRNWQTRQVQDLVPVKGVEVRVLSSAVLSTRSLNRRSWSDRLRRAIVTHRAQYAENAVAKVRLGDKSICANGNRRRPVFRDIVE